jgi:hypothetical protein
LSVCAGNTSHYWWIISNSSGNYDLKPLYWTSGFSAIVSPELEDTASIAVIVGILGYVHC